MQLDQISDLHLAATRLLGAWWKDDRRHWCAYCGIPMRRKAIAGATQPPSLATRDHVIPKAHRGGYVTIPACRECNVAKGTMSLPEFLESDHFLARRRNKHRNQWPLHSLWAVAGLAALKRAEICFHSTSPKPRTAETKADHTR
jgi:hypothetical protein